MSDTIAITTADGPFRCHVAMPLKTPAPVVVVVQEIFGINDDMKATCAELAASGYIALCPDLFWRQEPGLSLSHWSEAEWAKGLALYAAFDFDAGVSDLAATIAAGRALREANGKVGLIGYCLGGLMTFLVTARHGADAAVAYYGGGIEAHLGKSGGINSPLMMHFGEEDEFISSEALGAIMAALKGNPHARIFTYPDCSHAFARHTGTHYDASAAALANGRTWSFFEQYLR